MSLSYIPNDFARTWVQSQVEAKRGIHLPLAYIDINEGKRIEAELFAQIMYWHEPSKETGETRLQRKRDGHLWAVKNHADWWREARIKYNTARIYLKRLEERGLIFAELHGEKGKAATWIRVNWDEFERRMRIWMEQDFAGKTEKQCENLYKTVFTASPAPDIASHRADIQYQGVRYSISEGLIQNSNPNTETTAETTQRESSSSDEAIPEQPIVEAFVPDKTDTVQAESINELQQEDNAVASEAKKPDIADVAQEHIEKAVPKPKPKKKTKSELPMLRADATHSVKDWQLVISKSMNFRLDEQGCRHMTKYIRFFNGTCDYTTKRGDSLYNLYQCNGDIGGDGLENVSPLSLVQVVALTLYYRAWKEPHDKDKQATTYLPTGTQTLQEKCRNFLADVDYEKWMDAAKKKLEALLNPDSKIIDFAPTRPSHRIVTAADEPELSEADRAAALKHLLEFKAASPAITEKAGHP